MSQLQSSPSAPQATIKSAVGGVVIRGDEVLLIKRGRPPFKGHWSIPGGKVQFGEGLMDALQREVFEETSIRVEVLGLIDVFEALPDPKRPTDHYLMIDYACRFVSGNVSAGDDAEFAEFVPIPEAMARLAWDDTRHAIQGALPFFKQKV